MTVSELIEQLTHLHGDTHVTVCLGLDSGSEINGILDDVEASDGGVTLVASESSSG